MLQLNGLSLNFGKQKVFDSLSATIAAGEKVGLVGRNGSGKSTLLKAIAGKQPLDGGSVSIAGKGTLAYMPQEVVLNSSRSVVEEAFYAFTEIAQLSEQLKKLEEAVNSGDQDAVSEYALVSIALKELNPDLSMSKTKKILAGLGFSQERMNASMTSLSVGWQMRVVLAKLLLQNADFYLFDEPTNHLDIVAKDWFLGFLKEAKFGFMLVCHDRYFLDELCTKILELEAGRSTVYHGNYQDYENQKAQAMAHLHAAHEQQQKEIEQKRKTIERFKAKASKSKMAKSMERALDKIEVIEIPNQVRSVGFSFGTPERSGRMVLEVEKLGFSFGDTPIFKNVSFQIERGEKVAVIAPNGVGKTTLFNVLCGKYKPRTGTLHLGHNVKTTVFEQEQHKVLDPRKTVLQEVFDSTAHKTEQQIRSCLGSFLFSKEEVIKKTGVLSGGERNRVSMVKVLLQDANFLLLDEPTNHLDIQTKEILFDALERFEGTMLFVSHDHECVNRLASRILELTPDGVFSYIGNYESFLHQKAEQQKMREKTTPKKEDGKMAATSQSEPEQQPSISSLDAFELRKSIARSERKIEKLEAELFELRNVFGDLEYGTPEFATAQKNLAQKEAQSKAETALWEDLMSKLSS